MVRSGVENFCCNDFAMEALHYNAFSCTVSKASVVFAPKNDAVANLPLLLKDALVDLQSTS